MLTRESGISEDRAARLVRLAGKLRALRGQDLEEGVSTRLLVYAGTLIQQGAGRAGGARRADRAAERR